MNLGRQTFLDDVFAHGHDDIYVLQSAARLAVSTEKTSI
jgi:hypothetical protein